MREKHHLPSLENVLDILGKYGNRYSVVWRDVLLSVPRYAEESVYVFLRDEGDLIYSKYLPDFANNGVELIFRHWRKAFCGLFHLPGAIARSISKNRAS
jgi:hypothetical protein